jgi:hypothetical protein
MLRLQGILLEFHAEVAVVPYCRVQESASTKRTLIAKDFSLKRDERILWSV